MAPSKSYVRKRIESFIHAFRGILLLVREEPHGRIHLIAALVVVIAGFVYRLSVVEWLFIGVAITMVFASELMNTALENLCDAVSKERHPLIKKVKDLAAAAVFISALMAVLIGVAIFWPKFNILSK